MLGRLRRATSTRVRTAAAVALLLTGVAITGSLYAEPAGQSQQAQPQQASSGGNVDVRILGLNDLHGHLQPSQTESGRHIGGAATLAGYMDMYESENPGPTFRVHSGDMVGGSPLLSDHFHDDPTVQALNMMDLDAGVPGNHTFDKGPAEAKRLIEGGEREGGVEGFSGADFPYLAANVVERESEDTMLPPYKVLSRDGVKVGFIGVVTPETADITSTDSAGRYRFADISGAVNRYAADLRERGVKTVVVLAHSGGGQQGKHYSGEVFEETADMQGVDLVLAGHTHQPHNARVGGVPVLQAGPYGAGLSLADLEVSRATGETKSVSTGLVTPYARGPTDHEVAAHVERYASRTEKLSEREVGIAAEPVTRSATASGESALGDLVTDAHRSSTGSDFAFAVSGGLRDDLPEGTVTYGDLHNVQPFGEDLVKMELSGEQVEKVLEGQFSSGVRRTLQVSGLSYSYNASAPEGERITGVSLPGGATLNPSASYTITVAGPLADGGGGYGVFKEGRDRRRVGKITDSLASYVGSLPQPVSAPDPEAERRISQSP